MNYINDFDFLLLTNNTYYSQGNVAVEEAMQAIKNLLKKVTLT